MLLATLLLSLPLADDLLEISDLSTAADGQTLWAVDDERGTLFRVSPADGSIVETLPFGKKGDFEAVAAVEGEVFVGRSDGVLFAIDGGATTRFELKLPRGCNLEGMAYEPQKRRLLLACKSRSKGGWPIYAFDVRSMRLQRSPVFSIGRRMLEASLNDRGAAERFGPSGIAVHPKTGHLYVVSANPGMLVELDASGTILHTEALPRATFPQPEGIAFLSDGTLVISNEGRDGPATIVKIGAGEAMPR